MLWIVVKFFYWALADYGRSIARPLVVLVLSRILFYLGFLTILAPLRAQVSDVGRYDRAVGTLAFGNAVSFLGPYAVDEETKKFLFCLGFSCEGPVIPPVGYDSLLFLQNSFSIILVFFIGLALRNYFKIK